MEDNRADLARPKNCVSLGSSMALCAGGGTMARS